MSFDLEDFKCKVRDLVNDPKSDRWADADIIKYANEGYGLARELRPADFAETISVAMVPGEYQQVPLGYLFVEALGVSGEDPTEGGISTSLDEVMAKRFGKAACAPGCKADGTVGTAEDEYSPSSAKAKPSDSRGFTVSPAVPLGTSASLDVQVVNQNPPDILTSMMKTSLLIAVVHWVAHRFAAQNIESAYTEQRAAFFCDRFYGILNGTYQASARLLSGANLGGAETEQSMAQRDLRGILKQ